MEKRYDKTETVDSTELKMSSSHRRDGPTVKRAYFKNVYKTKFKTNNSPKTDLDVSGNPMTYEQGIERIIERCNKMTSTMWVNGQNVTSIDRKLSVWMF